MTETTNSTLTPEIMLAELAALPHGYEWIVNDWSDCDRILVDTHTEYRPAIEANRADIAARSDRTESVAFLLVHGEPWVYTAFRRPFQETVAALG